jgi:14-3-3 protein epsilon
MKTFKAKFNNYRNGWKNLLEFQQLENENSTLSKILIDKELLNLEKDIKIFCLSTIEVINKLEENEEDQLAKIFYNKLKADYLRYYCEVSEENEFLEFVEKSEELYKDAHDKCLNILEPNNPLTLSVVLNYSIFCYFILDDVQRAFNIADNIYKQSIMTLNAEQDNPEVESLIKSIEENLTIWKIELEGN